MRGQSILLAGHHLPASETFNGISLAGWWWGTECWLGSFVIFQGIQTSIAKKPNSFVIFQGGSRPPVPHPLWIRTYIEHRDPPYRCYAEYIFIAIFD